MYIPESETIYVPNRGRERRVKFSGTILRRGKGDNGGFHIKYKIKDKEKRE